MLLGGRIGRSLLSRPDTRLNAKPGGLNLGYLWGLGFRVPVLGRE